MNRENIAPKDCEILSDIVRARCENVIGLGPQPPEWRRARIRERLLNPSDRIFGHSNGISGEKPTEEAADESATRDR